MMNRVAHLVARMADQPNWKNDPNAAELFERIGRAVADFLEARRQDPFRTSDDHVARFADHERPLARHCFDAAEVLLASTPLALPGDHESFGGRD